MSKFETIRLGKTGTDVKVLQTVFRMLQYTGEDGKPIEINGICDANTVYAINHFQTVQRAWGYECGTDGRNDSAFGTKCWERLVGD